MSRETACGASFAAAREDGSPHWTISATGSSMQLEVRFAAMLGSRRIPARYATGAATTFAAHQDLTDSGKDEPVTPMGRSE